MFCSAVVTRGSSLATLGRLLSLLLGHCVCEPPRRHQLVMLVMEECELCPLCRSLLNVSEKLKCRNVRVRLPVLFVLVVQSLLLPALPPPDKNFEDDDSVDGGRSSSSSKGASLSGRKTVSMGSFRRPASASSAKSAGQSSQRLTCTERILMLEQHT